MITTHYAMAEREGFEPSVRITVQRFSRPSRSTTPASFQVGCKFSHIFWNDEKKLHFFPKNLKLIVPGGGLGVLVFADYGFEAGAYGSEGGGGNHPHIVGGGVPLREKSGACA